MVAGSSFRISAGSGGNRAVFGAGEISRRLIGDPDQARNGLRLRAHLLVRNGSVHEHDSLVVLVDGGDDTAYAFSQRHGFLSLRAHKRSVIRGLWQAGGRLGRALARPSIKACPAKVGTGFAKKDMLKLKR